MSIGSTGFLGNSVFFLLSAFITDQQVVLSLGKWQTISIAKTKRIRGACVMKATVTWQGKMAFQATGEASGNSVTIDGPPDNGGQNLGPRPMELLLFGLGGCTGIDVVLTLEKMRQNVESFSMEIEGERAEDHPRRFTDIHLVYKFSGDLSPDKVRRAITLSQEKYCSASQSLNANLSFSFEINGERFS